MKMSTRGDIAGFEHAVVSFVGDDGYPVSVATDFEVVDDTTVRLTRWVGVAAPEDREIEVTFSHIRPQPGIGYDERRYVNVWGRLRTDGDGFLLTAERSWGWDEQRTPFFQYSEEGVPQAHRYLGEVSDRTGAPVRPRLSFGWLALRTTRLPFLSATVIPVILGVAVAATTGGLRWGAAALTLLGAACIHLGLNVANDVFDARSGADAANTTPTPYSGGSRVIQYGLVRMRTMVALSAGLYTVGIAIGLWLAWSLNLPEVLWIGLAGVVVSLAYTAPPFRLVHRGLGEIAVAAGFGPIVTLGAYVVQTGSLGWEPVYASLPVGLLVAMILYVNEVPDRRADAAAGKRTLVVRMSREGVLRGYALLAASIYLLVVGGIAGGVLPPGTALALLSVPLAVQVHRGLRAHYDDPYALMPVMAKNINLHVFTGLGLIAGYIIDAVAS